MKKINQQDVIAQISNNIKCYVCGEKNMVVETTTNTIQQVIGSAIQEKGIVVIPVTCTNCGNMLLFNVNKSHKL